VTSSALTQAIRLWLYKHRVTRTLDSGVQPLVFRYSQINACDTKLPIAYRTETMVRSTDLGYLTPRQYQNAFETTDMGFSRAHFSLEVVHTAGGVCKYKLSDDENKNPTFINGIKLEKGDICLLKENDILKSSTVELQFLLK
jgi:hypothetical protein